IYSIWARDESRWSCWAKPVLFAYLDMVISTEPPEEMSIDVSWCPPPEEQVALVLDLSGAQGVHAGVVLAVRGYCPVPLYNAVPAPESEDVLDPLSAQTLAAVNVTPIMSALRNEAERLAHIRIPSNAPPAFLLDARRRGDGRSLHPEAFDNRSICF